MPANAYLSLSKKLFFVIFLLLQFSYKPEAQISSFEYPLEECFTYTYQLKIGDNGFKTFIKETITANNGELYNVGYVEDVAGNRKGLLQQINHTANIAWTKYISFADRKVVFTSVRQLPDGNLLVSGNSENNSTGDKNILFTTFDKDGVVQWCKSIMRSGYEAISTCIDSVPGLPTGIGFAAQNGSSILYGKLYNNGDIPWARETGNLGAGSIVGINAESNRSWFISYNTSEAGFGTGLVIRVNPLTGSLIWVKKFGGAASGKHYIFRETTFYNSSIRVAGLVKDGTGPYKIFLLSMREGGTGEPDLLIEVPSVTLDSTAKVAIDLRYNLLSFTASENDADIYLSRVSPWNFSGNQAAWTKKFSVPGAHSYINTQQCFDGGFIITKDFPGTAAGEVFTMLLKTDSTGSIKNCEGTNIVLNSILESHTGSDIVVAIGDVFPFVQNEAPVVNDHSITQMFSCKNLNCPVLPMEDTCLTSLTRKYRSADVVDLAYDIMPLNTENIMAGYTRTMNSLESSLAEGTLSRLNSVGKIIDRKKMQFGKGTIFTELLKLADGNFIAMGNSNYKSDFTTYDTAYVTISKFSPTLQLIWNKSFPRYGPYSAIYGIVESADGSLFINFVEGTAFNESPKLLKLNSLGQLVWLKKYTIPNSCVFGYVGSIIQDADYVYLMNFGSCDIGNIFMKIDKTTGNSVLTKGFNFSTNNSQWQGGHNMELMGDKIVLKGYVSMQNGARDVTYILDKNGNVLNLKAFSKADNSALFFKQKVTQNKEIVLVANSFEEGIYVRLDSNLNILRSRKTDFLNYGFTDIDEDINGSIIASGNKYSVDPYSSNVIFTRFDYDGHIGSCFSDSLLLDSYNMVLTETALIASVNDFPIALRALPFTSSTYSLQDAGLACGQVANCYNLQLTAPASVCDTMTHTAIVIRNTGCSLPVSFNYDNPDFIITERTDTSIIFKIMQPGTTRLIANTFTGCSWIRDTVFITSTPTNFTLGTDTSICENKSIVLNAGPGFSSYEWSDGSTQPQLTVTIPGMYFVKIRDACNNIQADTINVYQRVVPALSLGNDTITCNGAGLALTAPIGFMSYEWLPAYQLTQVSNNQVIAAPSIDTNYSVRVEYAPGCFTYDTIHIEAKYSLPVLLGPDKSFCAGDSVVLDAGAGYQYYTWNTGDATQTIVASTAGSYTVNATDINGCQSKDTMFVDNVYANPVVQLGTDFSLCMGTSRTLNAGNFKTYLWNDLSSSSTLVVNSPGFYYVRVTDQNQCKGSDSVRLNTILPLPEKFLPADTAICRYGSLNIISLNAYQDYLWSNNSTNSTLSITGPGIYWLRVRDRNGCAGTDSIKVSPKQCMEGFYIPNAFTPNNDGNNDNFKPQIFGDVIQYAFYIYNRYGQLVFQTNDLLKGWDGRYLAAEQNSGAFVWTCNYQLKNQGIKIEKGTVLLIK